MENKRDFKGVWVPRRIWLNKELSWMEKLFITEIDSLDRLEKGCFAGNEHFAQFFQLSKHRCSQIINSLIKKKYIEAEYQRKGLEIVKRVLRICHQGIKKMSRRCLENVKDINTNNNTINNTNIKKNKKFKPPTSNELQIYLDEQKITAFTADKFIDYYEARGWMLGKVKMKDWRAAVRTWKNKDWNKVASDKKDYGIEEKNEL